MVDTESQQHNPTPSGEKYMEKKYRVGETSDEYKKCILHRNLKKEERCRESYGHAEQTVFFLVRSVAEPNSLLNGDPGEEEEERNEHRAFAEEMLWESVDANAQEEIGEEISRAFKAEKVRDGIQEVFRNEQEKQRSSDNNQPTSWTLEEETRVDKGNDNEDEKQ